MILVTADREEQRVNKTLRPLKGILQIDFLLAQKRAGVVFQEALSRPRSRSVDSNTKTHRDPSHPALATEQPTPLHAGAEGLRFGRGLRVISSRNDLRLLLSFLYAATSARTSGWRSAIFNNCFAAPEGCPRPCSHCSRVRFDTPDAAANSVCDNPLFNRTRTTYDSASTSVLRMLHQELLQVGVLIVVQVCGKPSLKNGRFDECEHGRRIRLWRKKTSRRSFPKKKGNIFIFSG